MSSACFMLRSASVFESSNVTSSGASSSLDANIKLKCSVCSSMSAVFEDEAVFPRCLSAMFAGEETSSRRATSWRRTHATESWRNENYNQLQLYLFVFSYMNTAQSASQSKLNRFVHIKQNESNSRQINKYKGIEITIPIKVKFKIK